jgi:hypothetical protein
MKRIPIFFAALFWSLSLAACSTGNQANTSLLENDLPFGDEIFAGGATTPPPTPSTEPGIDDVPAGALSEDDSNGEAFADTSHSDGDITITGGNLALQSGEDGIHSDATLTVNGGVIDVKKSYEGLEAANVVINEGTISAIAQDDGLTTPHG